MRINVYNSEFDALQLSGIQFSLLKNKRQKHYLLQILQILILNISTLIHTIFQLYIFNQILIIFWCLHLLRNSDLLIKTRLSPIELTMKNFSVKHNLQKLLVGFPLTMHNIFHLTEGFIFIFVLFYLCLMPRCNWKVPFHFHFSHV